MSAAHKDLIARDLDRLFRNGSLPPGDGELLERFLSGGDESAFAAIVDRHGPMVLGVCRRLLDNSHDADDAFQATFLVLVRKARHLRDANRLGPWLYGVASRVASKARAREAKRKARFSAVPRDVPSAEAGTADWVDVRPILDAELSRLPVKLREILVLCLLEGSTAEEAAHRISCPVGTVKSRLARGREALRDRLVVRGLAPVAAVAVVSGAARSVLASSVSSDLSRMAMSVAGLVPGQISGAVVALTKGAAPRMLRKSSLWAIAACGGIALGSTALVTWTKPHAIAAQPDAPPAGRPADPDAATTSNHMKQIGLAFHNYYSVNNQFPTAAISARDGAPLLSWRVALLPYLEQQALYEAFRKDEPWDSPHNKALIARMPEVFTTPHSPTNPGMTRIRGFEGPGTMFDGIQGVQMQEVLDGTSNTILTVNGREAVPWTKPSELHVADGKPLPKLDQDDNDRILIGLADGSVRRVSGENQAFLRSIITRAGGEVINWPPDEPGPTAAGPQPEPVSPAATPTPAPIPAPTAPAGAMRPGASIRMPGPGAMGQATPTFIMTSPAAQIPPALEQRLRAIEAKLDRLLLKLDASDGRPRVR